MTPTNIQNTFLSVLDEAEKNISSYVYKPGSDMTRHRFCTFSDTVLETLCMAMNRTNTELLQYFKFRNSHIPSKSAFTQQRKKLKPNFFPYLLDSFNQAVPFKKNYKGFRLIAVDGSDINLPTDKNDYVYRIKQARSDNYYFQMHLNALFDICEDRYLSAVIQPRPEMNESKAFCSMVDSQTLPEHTIFIADRGYISTNTLAHLITGGKHFLIRAKSPFTPGSFLKNLMTDKVETDKNVCIAFSRSKKVHLNRPIDEHKIIRKDRLFEGIPLNDMHSVYYMNLRCSCIKLEEDSYEYLISNLSMETFSLADLKLLYWKRWSIETSFRRLKYALALSYLHSVNRELIIQEIYAKMTLYNFASLLRDYAQNCKELLSRNKKTKYKYNVSFDNAVPVARSMLIGKMCNKTIKALLLMHLTAEKECRPSARHMRSQTVNPLNNRA